MLAAVCGWVGSGMATEYLAFREHFHLLHNVVDEVFSNPKMMSVPGDTSVQHALVGAISQRVKERNGSMTDSQLNNVVVFAKAHLPRVLQGLLCLHCVAAIPGRFLSLPDTSAWCFEHAAIVKSWSK